jgi:hypothetical protein
MRTDDVVRFLDALRAAETAGAEVLAAWADVCELDGLRGGLRAIGEREAGHAELLGERLAELGRRGMAVLAEPFRREALGRFGSATVSDEEKLAFVLKRYPDDGEVARPILRVVDSLEDDPETRELLRLVADGENATVAWLRAYHRGLRHAGRAGGRPEEPARS